MGSGCVVGLCSAGGDERAGTMLYTLEVGGCRLVGINPRARNAVNMFLTGRHEMFKYLSTAGV